MGSASRLVHRKAPCYPRRPAPAPSGSAPVCRDDATARCRSRHQADAASCRTSPGSRPAATLSSDQPPARSGSAALTRGRPLSPGRRGGSYRPASSRSRVTTSRYGLTERSNSMTEKLLSATIRRPAGGLQQRLTVGQLLVPSALLLCVAFGRRQDGQERQRPDAAGPGNGREQHDAQPTQTTRFDKVTGADWVPVDALIFVPQRRSIVSSMTTGPSRTKAATSKCNNRWAMRRADQRAVLSTR